MKLIILVAVAFAAVAVAAPAADYIEPVKTLRSETNQNPDGSYNFGFETENGISRSETGELKEVLDEDKKPHTVVVVRGSYNYVNKDGYTETINYHADENGFNAEGPSVPKVNSRR